MTVFKVGGGVVEKGDWGCNEFRLVGVWNVRIKTLKKHLS